MNRRDILRLLVTEKFRQEKLADHNELVAAIDAYASERYFIGFQDGIDSCNDD